MNPYRRRKKLLESKGLDFSPYLARDLREDAKSQYPLVYQVYRAPEALMMNVWDYGSPNNSAMDRQMVLDISQRRTPFPSDWVAVSDEILFAENMVHWMIKSTFSTFESGDQGLSVDFTRCDHAENEGTRHLRYLRILFCSLFKYSQEFVRKKMEDTSAASLRDIHRTISRVPFLVNLQKSMSRYNNSLFEDHRFPFFDFLNSAILSSFVLNYALRLGTLERQDYFAGFVETWNSSRGPHSAQISNHFLPTPASNLTVYAVFDDLATSFCNCLCIDPGMAVNEALKENVFSLYCSIMGSTDTGTAQFIVGRPGSSKSSSLDILCASSDPTNIDPRTKFFRENGHEKIEKFVLQCDPDTRASDIEKQRITSRSTQTVNAFWYSKKLVSLLVQSTIH
jgi:hypothetical protein